MPLKGQKEMIWSVGSGLVDLHTKGTLPGELYALSSHSLASPGVSKAPLSKHLNKKTCLLQSLISALTPSSPKQTHATVLGICPWK